VEDSGIGIEPEHSARLFNAFFTTKPDGMGMTINLRSIIEATVANCGPQQTYPRRHVSVHRALNADTVS